MNSPNDPLPEIDLAVVLDVIALLELHLIRQSVKNLFATIAKL